MKGRCLFFSLDALGERNVSVVLIYKRVNVNDIDILVFLEGKITHPKNNAENADMRTRNVGDPQSEVLLGSTMRTS